MAAVAAEIEAVPVGGAWIIAATYGGRLLSLEVIEEVDDGA